MKFYILKDDYERAFIKQGKGPFRLSEGTSLVRYIKWFFECISQHGRIIPLDRNLTKERLGNLLGKPEAIFVSILEALDKLKYRKVPRRHLSLSLGSLLVYLDEVCRAKRLPTAQILLVSTEYQIKRLDSIFHGLMPKMHIFPHKVDTGFFVPPDKKQRASARKKQGIKKGQVHIVYAGRWIVTKGICQLIRTLDIWPIPNMVLTLAGNLEEDVRIAYSFTRHNNFMNFLDSELFQKKRSWLRLQPARNKKDLRELFWSADLFVNPSIQPDENFGITPREAVSCGLPIVATNFGGLYPLAEGMPWKGLNTYPTILGSRFSLREFGRLLDSAIKRYGFYTPGDYRKNILEQCSPETAKKNLKAAIEYLKNRLPEKPLDLEIVQRRAAERLFNTIDAKALKLFINSRQKLPAGSHVYGDGTPQYTLPIIQGIFSAKKAPPVVEKCTRWRGFFRISLWERERALVEFGFPGPRIRHFSKKQWNSLLKCAHLLKSNDYIIIPTDKLQASQVQELVDLGYLVSDD